ncbi:LysR family transcriptional regulator [Xylophilus sp. GOD-11R]|uniref:LysR family transcriptional regulator n=1 Tax=Xylophilus sp. GOD-11R TaxID=3089814 RepID=UPI00298C528E|nr:LysR family transcriptional regulator [Xylophilus sp. GOD-11R]WPB55315.1 LysR family transcriptional regulator [Xylophilus sp. GOD-11R]
MSGPGGPSRAGGSLDTRPMRYLLAIADAGSLTHAAEALGVAQPALSQAINRLEADLGVRLFDRSRRGATLTEAGRAIIDDVRASLALATSATQRARAIAGGKAGRLHIGFVTHAVYDVLPSALRLLRTEFPGVEVELSEMGNADQLTALEQGAIDLAMLHTPLPLPGRVRTKLVRREKLVAVLPVGHPLGADGRVGLAEIAALGLVWFPERQLPAMRAGIVAALQRAGLDPHFVQEANRTLTVLSCVAAGLGASLLPQSAAVLAHRGVQFADVRDGDGLPHFELGVLWIAANRPTLAEQLADRL